MPESITAIPLFPLDTVLFPGMVLPLHIFEERYKQMIHECLEREQPFGILLAKRAWQADDTLNAFVIGTSAMITDSERLEDGRFDIQTAGIERFRVLQVLTTEPYAVGRVEWIPLQVDKSAALAGQIKETGALFARYLRLMDEVAGTSIEIENVPRDPASLAYLVAIALQVPMEEKQELLGIDTLVELLAREAHLLDREKQLLQRMRAAQESNAGYVRGATGFVSLN